MTTLIVGDSHARCIHHALRGWKVKNDFEVIKVAREGEGPNAGEETLESVCRRVSQLGEGDFLFTALLGRMHNVYGLVTPEVPFDFFEYPGDENVSPHYQMIPNSTMKGILLHYMTKPGAFSAILAASKVKPAIIAPPPIIGSHSFIKSTLTKYRGQSIAERGVGKIRMRLKLRRFEVACLHEFAESHGLHFLPEPPESKTVYEVMWPELYGKDATHANKLYGRMVLAQVKADVEARRADAEVSTHT